MSLYISKKCMDCNKLLIELDQEGLSKIFTIVVIDVEPYPNIIKSVPAIINDGNLYQGNSVITFINQLLVTFGNQNKKTPEKKIEKKEEELQCYGGSCLEFSSFNEENINMLDNYGLINEEEGSPNITMGEPENTNPKMEKQKTFDDDYNRMMESRAQFK